MITKNLHIALVWMVCLVGLVSCSIYDEQGDCSTKLKFRYVYNMQNANGLADEADKVTVWLFDENGKLVSTVSDSGKNMDENYELNIGELDGGNYRIVAWAQSTDEQGELANFTIPTLQKGDDISLLTAKLNRNADNTNDQRLNNLLYGNLDASINGGGQTLTVDLHKATNTIRILMVPLGTSEAADLQPDDLEFRIEGQNGWLDYKGDPYNGTDNITYLPCLTEMAIDSTSEGGNTINRAIIAEFSVSRIMADQEPRLIIYRKGATTPLMNINLSWFLTLQGIGEHKEEWSNQEYLDRQDYYAMTFFFNENTWMKYRIIVNGWKLSLEDIAL